MSLASSNNDKRRDSASSASPDKHATAAAEKLLASSCPYPLESFVYVLPVPPQHEKRRGILRFVGPVDFADGVWAGIELVGSFGRNDGNVKGRKYFQCLPGQGLFVKPELVGDYGGANASAPVVTGSSTSNPHVAAPETTTEHARDEEKGNEKKKLLSPSSSDDLVDSHELERASQGIIEQQKIEITKLHEKLRTATERAAVLEAQAPSSASAAAAQHRSSDRGDEVSQISLELHSAAAQRNALTAEKEALLAQIAQERNARAAVEESFVKTQKTLDELQVQHRNALEAQERQVHLHKAESENLQRAMETLRQEMERKAARELPPVDALPSRPAPLPAMESDGTLVKELQEANAALQSALDMRVAECAQLTSMLDTAKATLSSKETQSEDTLKHAQTIQQLEGQLVTQQRQHEESRREWTVALDSVRTEKASVLQEADLLQARIAELNERMRYQQQQQFHAPEVVGAAQTKLGAEMAELQELYGLLEEELGHEKAQSDGLACQLKHAQRERETEHKTLIEQKQTLENLLQHEGNQLRDATRRCEQLQEQLKGAQAALYAMEAARHKDAAAASLALSHFPALDVEQAVDEEGGSQHPTVDALLSQLDAARLRIFQLTKEAETAAVLQAQCDELGKELDALRVRQRKRELALVEDYEEAVQQLRKGKEEAEQACAEARAQLRENGDKDNNSGRCRRSHKGRSQHDRGSELLSGEERLRYERQLASLQLKVLLLQSGLAGGCVPVLPRAAGTAPFGCSASRPLETLAQRARAEIALTRQQVLGGAAAGGILDFSTSEACATSARKMFHA